MSGATRRPARPGRTAGSRSPAAAGGPPPDAVPVTDLDPRGVRVRVVPATALEGDPVRTVVPGDPVVVDGSATTVRLERDGSSRAYLVREDGAGRTTRTLVLLGEPRTERDGTVRREVVVDGWRVELVLEDERRAALRERSRRGVAAGGGSGPHEVRAIIPGRIVAVSVGPGDRVGSGQQLLVLEAMKMQNELRAPREGTVRSVAVALGGKVEVGDLLLVIE